MKLTAAGYLRAWQQAQNSDDGAVGSKQVLPGSVRSRNLTEAKIAVVPATDLGPFRGDVVVVIGPSANVRRLGKTEGNWGVQAADEPAEILLVGWGDRDPSTAAA